MTEFINPVEHGEDNTVSDHEDNKGIGIEDDKVNLDSFINDDMLWIIIHLIIMDLQM